MNGIKLARLIGLCLLPVLPAFSALLTSASQIGTSQTVIDFAQFAGANTISTQGPVLVGPGVTFSSTNPDGSDLGSGPYSFNDNGSWDASVTLAGLDVDTFGGDRYTMTFAFAQPVMAVGGTIDYAAFPASGFSDVTMTAIGSNGSVLESYDITALQASQNLDFSKGGLFLGIGRGQADIAKFSLSNSAVAIQDLTLPGIASASPEPATNALLGVASLLFIGLKFSRRRR